MIYKHAHAHAHVGRSPDKEKEEQEEDEKKGAKPILVEGEENDADNEAQRLAGYI